MKLLILSLFCFGVNANKYQYDENIVLRPGLAILCGKSPVEKAIGPIEDNDKRSSQRRIAEFAKKNGNALVDNEELVLDEDNFVYPCPTNDIECIRQALGANCRCKPIYGPVPDPLCLAENRAFFPSINVTGIYTNVEFRGLGSAKIYSFYQNKKTGYLVLSIYVKTLAVYSPKICLEYHRPGKEPIVKCDCATVTYKSLILTAEFPGLHNKCRLDLADIHGYCGDSNPAMYIGPKAYNSTDPTVKAAYKGLLEKIPTIIKENLLFKSQQLMSRYIQSYLCYFDINICSI